MMLYRLCLSAVLLTATPACAEVILACAFPTLPDTVMRFPDELDADKTMQVGGRPAVPLTEGEGSGRLISASVDGYDFRFAPENLVMEVERDGSVLLSETGECVTIGGPESAIPLEIAAVVGSSVAQDSEAEVAPASKGRWIVTEDTSAFDDSRTVVLTIDSNEAIRGQFGGPGPVTMFLRCKENRTVLYLWLNDLFLSDIQGFGVVDYRIDDQKAATVRMESSTDNKALGLWDGGKSIPFLKKLMDGQRVVFRATPFNESPVEFSFDLTGLETAISPLREACSW